MRKSVTIFILTILFFGTAFSAIPFSRRAGMPRKSRPVLFNRNADVLPDRIIVKRSSTGLAKFSRSWEQALQKVAAAGLEPVFPTHTLDSSQLSRIFEIQLSPGVDVFDASEILMRDASIEWAEPVYLRKVSYDPTDPGILAQWYLSRIKAKEAWNIFKQNANVVIGIIDTGIWTNHPDLSSNIWVNTDEIPGNGKDDDRNGYVDDIRGWDFGDGDNDPNPKKDGTSENRWHGTWVGGVASAATDNAVGIAATSFNAKLMPIKSARDSDQEQYIISSFRGIVYAADNGANIINCSFGSSSSSQAEQEAIAHARGLGCLVVAAAGNGITEEPEYPASLSKVLSAAAVDEGDVLAPFSNYGYAVDVSAPGMNMYTTFAEMGYGFVDGTSFSAPLTASVAALVKGLHPAWTGDQVGEQVRISCDPIDTFNPDHVGKMGKGRINAFNALTLKSPSVRVDTTQLTEGAGSNRDGIFDPGEELLLMFTAKNYLEPASAISVVFSCSNPSVTIENSTFFIPSLGTLQSWENKGNPVKIKISRTASRGQTVSVSVSIQASGGYQDTDRFFFDVSNSYATLHAKNAALTVTAMGRLGLSDINTGQGEGFVYQDEGSLLFEGAVLAGISADTLSDVARGSDGSTQNNDFETTPGGEIRIAKPGAQADEQGEANFSDELASPSLHLGVNLNAYAYNDTTNADYVLLAYRLYNTSTTPIRKLYFGLFMDWDVNGDQDAWNNLGGFDPALSLGYVYEKLASVYGGLSVVSKGGATIYKCIKNSDEIYPDVGGYSKQEKWFHLSGGIRTVAITEESDYSNVLGVGPLTLNPGDTVRVGFAAVGGKGLNALKAHTLAAKNKWQALFEKSDVQNKAELFPTAFRLYHAYPNPFNPETVIRYDLPQRGPVVLTVHDLLGREVARPVDSVQEPGLHEVHWNARNQSGNSVPSGVYFCRLQSGGRTLVLKLSFIR